MFSLQDAFDEDSEQMRLAGDQRNIKVTSRTESPENPCSFDKTNKKSPCYFERCDNEEDLKCIKYILEYCGMFEDRGCVVNKPQLLNKKDLGEMMKISSSRPLFKP